ncbi:MAG TPA: hypothetical protein VFH48_00865 [Chloroflexota bacterium]|nr:hypothetical protein [Chloroflexota bacterium]
MLRNRIALTAAGFVAGVAMTAATIGSTVSPAAANPAQQMDAAAMAAQKAQVIAATFQLDKSSLHDIEEQSKVGTIMSGALGNVRRARIATQATDWPEAMKPMATALVADMKTLEEAIRTEDPTKVVDPATKVHNGGHDLSAAVYTWLETGKAPEGHGHGH